MTDRPIIFSAPMVRALLDGRKTQTRRLATSPLRVCEPGDRLYVREAWTIASVFSDVIEVRYQAHERHGHSDHVEQVPLAHGVAETPFWPKYRPSIHMPRWASRVTLIIEQAWQEPLRAIPGHDALREGVEREGGDWKNYGADEPCLSARESYATLWDALHTAEGERWQDNPRVVALAFRVERGNIDRIPV